MQIQSKFCCCRGHNQGPQWEPCTHCTIQRCSTEWHVSPIREISLPQALVSPRAHSSGALLSWMAAAHHTLTPVMQRSGLKAWRFVTWPGSLYMELNYWVTQVPESQITYSPEIPPQRINHRHRGSKCCWQGMGGLLWKHTKVYWSSTTVI